MNRRQFVASGSFLGVIGLAGCVALGDEHRIGDAGSGDEEDKEDDEAADGEDDDDDEGDWGPDVTVDDPTIPAGETGTLRIEAKGIGYLDWRSTLEHQTEGVEIEYEPDDVTPGEFAIIETYPPAWAWGEPTEVEAEVPVRIADDANPGEYELSLTVAPRKGSGRKREVDFTITVS